MTSENIPLNRNFYPVSEESADFGDYETRIAFGLNKAIHWETVLENKRVVVIAEAGAGKTHELFHQAQKLRDDGKVAFFIRLEYLKNGIETAFENLGEDDCEDFKTWKDSQSNAYIFLDSVDEAKLSDPRDFELALKKLRRVLGSAFERTTIVISSRPTFQPKSELELFNRHLPCPDSRTARSVEFQEADANEDTASNSETITAKDNKAVIFSLASLSRDQIKKYSIEKGTKNPDEFMEAIDRSNVQKFASRPRDLDGIVSNWIAYKSIGSKRDVIEANIKRRIEEVDLSRGQLSPLTTQKALTGIQAIAAVCTLTSHSRIAVPDKDHSPNAVSIKDVLPDWQLAEQLALLQRPIFDDAAYGTIRFHDRDIREFLTAKWIEKLLDTGSRREIEALFFHTQYGVEVTRPKTREVLAWVALIDDKIRNRALKVSPSVLLDGGDPSQFPPEFKTEILNSTCSEMATDDSLRYSFNTAAVERFSDRNIETTVSNLFKQYKAKRPVVDLLLRMVWQGKLTACKSEALSFALDKDSEKYTRVYALRACASVCENDEIGHIISHFVSSKNETNRRVISELLEVFPSKISAENLSHILARLPPPERYSSDGLDNALEQIIAISDQSKLEIIFAGLAELTLKKPHIGRRYCEVSQEYKWLLKIIAKACERLIEMRSSIVISPLGLEVLSQCGAYRDSGYGDGFKTKLSTLVPVWEELNCLSFWHDADRARSRREDTVNHVCQVGSFRRLWNLSDVTFEKSLCWIESMPKIDDKLIALSIAFSKYRERDRKPADRHKIKALCADNTKLKAALHIHLHPPAMSESERNHRQWESRFEKNQAIREQKQKQILTDGRKFAAKNLDLVGYIDEDGEGKVYQVQSMLFNRMRTDENHSSKWANTNWEYLNEDQSPEVAQKFKQFLTTTWKHYTPELCSEVGDCKSSQQNYVIYGLSGLGILAAENRNWTSSLSENEAKLACRYAIQEMNGPPEWLEKVHQKHPTVVVDTFFREIQWELFEDQGEQPPHYALDKVSWHCKWMSQELAPLLLEELSTKKTRFEESLKKCLEILLASDLISYQQLITLAKKKIVKSNFTQKHLWFFILISVVPAEGIKLLTTFLEAFDDKNKATKFAMKFVVSLVGTRRRDATQNRQENYKTVEHLQSLYMLMNQHIHMSDDIDRVGKGCYSPELRDDAQDARSSLFTELTKIPGKEAYLALKCLSDQHPYENARTWMENNARTHLENEADLPEWSAENVLDFSLAQECKPCSPKELFDIAKARLNDLKYGLENADDSVATSWIKETQETRLRILIANWLRSCTNNKYSVHQEEEQADRKTPDLRLHSTGFDAPVPIELKIADKWTGNKLSERLKNQLCNDYLRDDRTRFGVFLLVYRGKGRQSWEIPNRHNFEELVLSLHQQAKNYIAERSDIEDVEVIGIDLTKRSTPHRPGLSPVGGEIVS